MLIEKGFTDKWLRPTGAQERLLRQYAGCKRLVWNRALSIEQARYCRGEKMVGCTQRMHELTMWRHNPDPHSNFLREAPVHALQCVLWELYESYDWFFNKEQVHPPQSKKKARLSFTECDPASFELEQPNKWVRLPKLGWVKYRWTQKIEGQPNSVTVRWDGGRWILSVQCQVDSADPIHPAGSIVAGDFGVVCRVTFSDGVVVPPVDVSWEEQRKTFCQRRLRNKRKFSQNWKKVFCKIRKLDSRMANIRKDEAHKFTSQYVKNHAVIVLGEALLASGYRASVNGLWNGRSWDSATKQEPIEEVAQCVPPQ